MKYALKNLLVGLALTTLVGLVGLAYMVYQILIQRAAYFNEVSNQKKEDVKVTIVEGKRREEIATIMAKAGICSFEDFLVSSKGKEGMLFPDTYRFYPNTPAKEVVSALTENFTTKTTNLLPTESQIILASIVEREAKTDAERPVIAGVYMNRLTIGMKLDADPTVQYAKDSLALASSIDSQGYTFWKPITQLDYSGVISEYNTYLNTGLPPGAIANPGLKSIQAAQNPATHDYYYFLHRDGQILLSKTLSEHQNKQ
jgi:UPF0755 protein